ncbi:flagellar filament capping protein FliD [Selenomonas sp. oral taxon 138]|uniref:flagellar filament capping protein FliD n=1 Tax=Selenomonas sp. oral taxon 138 TaxID=712532 RepID=UPI0003474F83|nr:flagellar filament capping protein FliD [Selenomonas sp. oral taxon 138]
MAGARGIYGLSGSGLDVESLVKVGMISQQKKYDRIYKKEVETEWRKEAYANVYDKVNTFRSRMSDYRLSSSTKPMTTTSSLADSVTATANASAGVMSHTVEVTQAASNAYFMTATGQHVERANTGASSSVMLKDVAFAGGTMPAGMAPGDTALKFKVSNGTGSAEVTFTAEEVFTKNLTLNDLANRINNARYTDSSGKKTALDIRAGYDSVSDGFSLFNTKTGDSNKINLSVDTTSSSAGHTTTLLSNLKLGSVSNGAISAPVAFTTSGSTSSLEVAGTNANVKIDGRTYNNLQENNLTVNGVTYTFKKPTAGAATINVAQDQDKLVENVKKFVEEYNALLDDLVKQYGDKGHKDYGVLTKSQEDGMTKDQVEKWNAKAKEGLLYRDSYLRSIIGDLRDAVINRVESVPGRYSTLSSIGITAKNQTGHLQLDETKLKAAIAAEPDAVNRLISYDDENNDFGNNGVASRIYNKMSGRMKEMERHSGVAADKTDLSELGKLIQNYEKQMSDFKRIMSSFESKLYEKYNAMEVAISRLSTQFNFFNAQ